MGWFRKRLDEQAAKSAPLVLPTNVGCQENGEMCCPECEHEFTPPDILIVTAADVARYGRDPVQCPTCRHIWNADRSITTFEG